MKTAKPAVDKNTIIAARDRRILELEAQLLFAYTNAYKEIEKTSTQFLMASGIIVQLSALGGRELCKPFMIADGLSDETIAAIKADIKRSYDRSTINKIK